jgi:TPR repeat protein
MDELKVGPNVRIPLQRNLEKAAYWYKKAYKSGDNCGALNLAIDRRKQGNIRSAVIWFKISSTSRTRENGQRGSGGASARAFSPECT